MLSWIKIETQYKRPGSCGELLIDGKAFKLDSKGFDKAVEWLHELKAKYESLGFIGVEKEAESDTITKEDGDE